MQYPINTTPVVPEPSARIFDDLNNEQAHGILCVVCKADFYFSGIHAEPVGRSAATGEAVFACPPCVGPALREASPGEQLALEAGR